MSLFVRTLLVWLLVLSIPAQGVAAATMAFCGPDHHGASTPAEVHDASGHLHHGDVASLHAPVSVADVVATATDTASATEKASAVATQTCSACATCCTVGAIPGTVPGVPVTDTAPAVFTTLVTTVDAFAPDGLERPPRHVPA